jgi:hypothetical protein
MHKNLAILASAVLILSPFSAPTLAFAVGVPLNNLTLNNLNNSLATIPATISSPLEVPMLLAQNNRARRIEFASGASAATVSGSVVRGDRAIYAIRGDRGQTMAVTIDSNQEQGEALFDVISPNGEILTSGSATFRQALPQSGDYRIIVGGSRGNASFNMTVSIN